MKVNIKLAVKKSWLALTFLAVININIWSQVTGKLPLNLPELKDVSINDPFWGPKFKQWRTTTITDVLDKFEGKYEPTGGLYLEVRQLGQTRDAFKNFDLVAQGKRGIGLHYGPPWYDGLVYESIRSASDFLAEYPDPALEMRLDSYIDRIAAAQKSDPDGYLNTYTQLIEPAHQWGLNGGQEVWQHDVYNLGMLFEAGVHYYKATGKTKLLNVAVKFANYVCNYMGPAPKKNIVPGHSGPEEAAMKLYWLFKKEPNLKKKMDVPIDENQYYNLAKFWIEGRGNHCGLPVWNSSGANEAANKWIREARYSEPQYGNHSRPSWGNYAQDSVSLFQQKTIEGHAVRATLFTTGATAVAIENKAPKYIEAVSTLWDNMAGKRMFITGGVGAMAHDEKFGPDYYLPIDAYLETCAAVGAAFFSQRMNQLTGNAKYFDEFERSLYNGVLTTISSSGTNYTYQNPLNSEHHQRWGWHDCPCCPPMFLKIVSALPGFIYSYNENEIYVNLFLGSRANINLGNKLEVIVKQTTNYPLDGKVLIEVSPKTKSEFSMKVRIPGWAVNVENPYGLYRSQVKGSVSISVNGVRANMVTSDGYVTISRTWEKGDKIELSLPMNPRFVFANDLVKELNGKVALASGPLVYCLEENMNPNLKKLKINTDISLSILRNSDLLNGINVITGITKNKTSEKVVLKAIPYYAIGNIKVGDAYKVWVSLEKIRE